MSSNNLVLEVAPSDGYFNSNVSMDDAVIRCTDSNNSIQFCTTSNAVEAPLVLYGSNVTVNGLFTVSGPTVTNNELDAYSRLAESWVTRRYSINRPATYPNLGALALTRQMPGMLIDTFEYDSDLYYTGDLGSNYVAPAPGAFQFQSALSNMSLTQYAFCNQQITGYVGGAPNGAMQCYASSNSNNTKRATNSFSVASNAWVTGPCTLTGVTVLTNSNSCPASCCVLKTSNVAGGISAYNNMVYVSPPSIGPNWNFNYSVPNDGNKYYVAVVPYNFTADLSNITMNNFTYWSSPSTSNWLHLTGMYPKIGYGDTGNWSSNVAYQMNITIYSNAGAPVYSTSNTATIVTRSNNFIRTPCANAVNVMAVAYVPPAYSNASNAISAQVTNDGVTWYDAPLSMQGYVDSSSNAGSNAYLCGTAYVNSPGSNVMAKVRLSKSNVVLSGMALSWQ